MLVHLASIMALAAAGVQLNVEPGDVLTYRTTYESTSISLGKETGSKTSETRRCEFLSETGGWFQVRETTVASTRETTAGEPLPYDTTGLVVTFDVYRALLMRNWKLVDFGRLGAEQGRQLSSDAKSTESRGFLGLVLPGGDLNVVDPAGGAVGALHADREILSPGMDDGFDLLIAHQIDDGR